LRIGLTAQGTTPDELVEYSVWAESAGFTSVWFPSPSGGDPVAAMALAGRATFKIELGTAVLQTYPCHPLLQANRVAAAAVAMRRPGFTLGIGPSHEPLVAGMYGLSYEHPGRSTDEYVRILSGLVSGQDVDFVGEDWSAHGRIGIALQHPVPILVSALSPRLLRTAGGVADGTILYLTAARVIESRVVPQIRAAAAEAGRPSPRVVAGLPVAVHDDEAEARHVFVGWSSAYGSLRNYQRVLSEAGLAGAADVAIVGNETSVAKQLRGLTDAGATDVWLSPFPVGDDPTESLRRTTDLLASLVS
jgi:F420-dependent oxidoreductase-like protein